MGETSILWLGLLALLMIAYWKWTLLGVALWLVSKYGVEPAVRQGKTKGKRK